MKKILLLGSQHGNERLGDALYDYIRNNTPHLLDYCDFLIGNPRAYKQNKRYTEADLNRSFGKSNSGLTYESRRARQLQTLIKHGNFDIILDLHTTACKQPPCAIINEMNEHIRPFLRASAQSRIVLLRDPIVASSLIGTNPRAISIEVNQNELTPQVLKTLSNDITSYIKDRQRPFERKVYTVNQLLLKTEVSPQEAARLKNFEKTATGYIPILTGENSYKKNTHYLGFKAEKEELITL